jgi:hypothetical protein
MRRARGEPCAPYHGTSFSDVWRQLKSDPYELPHYKVTLRGLLGVSGRSFVRDARRTLCDERDLLPPFRKRIRANGICLAGEWLITEPGPYTGYFTQGSRGLLIARASVALSQTERGHYRSFGMACKLYPTTDPTEVTKTANFFVIDNNAGTLMEHYLDAAMLNDPKLSLGLGALFHAPLLLTILLGQRLADSHPSARQLYPVAAIGAADPGAIRAPKLLRIQGAPGPRVAARDFRDELRVAHYGGCLRFDIHARDHKNEPWARLGHITFTDDVVSDSGDHRLHFQHPPWRRPLV